MHVLSRPLSFSFFLNWTTLGKRTNGKGSYGTFCIVLCSGYGSRIPLTCCFLALCVCMKVPWCIGSRAFSVVCGLYVVGTPCVCFCSRLGSGRDKAGSLGFGRCGSVHLPCPGVGRGLYCDLACGCNVSDEDQEHLLYSWGFLSRFAYAEDCIGDGGVYTARDAITPSKKYHIMTSPDFLVHFFCSP
jgi:hypothetical protein